MEGRPYIRRLGILVVLAVGLGLAACKSDNAVRSPDLPAPVLKSFTFDCDPSNIDVGQTSACKATCVYTVVNENGQQVNQNICVNFSCSSANTSVAAIDGTTQQPAVCQVRGTGPGTVNINASVEGGVGSQTITVNAAALTGLDIVCPANTQIVEGTSRQFTANASFADGSTCDITNGTCANNPNIAPGITWDFVPPPPSFASVSNTAPTHGRVTTTTVNGDSPATLRATVQNQTDTCPFTVVDGSVTTLCVEPDDGSAITTAACAPPTVTLDIGSTQNYRARAIFNNGTASNVTLDATWSSSVPTVACVYNDANNDGDALDAGDVDCASAPVRDGKAVARGVGTTNVTAVFGGQTGMAPLNVIASQRIGRNSLLIGNPQDGDVNGVLDGTIDDNDVPGKFFCIGFTDLVAGLNSPVAADLPGNKQMTAQLRTCSAALDGNGNCPDPTPGTPVNENLVLQGNELATINEVVWDVPQDRSFWDGNDCATTQTQATTGNIPSARVNSPPPPLPFVDRNAPNRQDPRIKGNVTAIGAVRLGTSCVRGTIARPGVGSDFDGATALVLPITNDVLLEDGGASAVQLCNALVPLFELGLQGGPGAVTQLVAVLSDILNPILTAIAQDQTGGGPIPTDDIIEQLTAALSGVTDPILTALQDVIDAVNSGVYTPVNCAVGTLLEAILSGDPGQVAAIQACAP